MDQRASKSSGGTMSESSQQPTERQPRAARLRLEATVHPGEKELSLEGVADLDLDRVPDPEGGVRLLVTEEEAIRLVQRGYEVHLLRVLPVRSLDASLVMDDASDREWLEDRVQGIERHEDS